MFPNTKLAQALLIVCCGAASIVVLSCSSNSDLPPPKEPAKVDTSEAGASNEGGTSADGSGNTSAGGSATAGGAPNEPGAGGEPEAGTPRGEGGASENSSSGGEPAVDPTPLQSTCTGERAFTASSGAFIAPTDKALAEALNDGIYGISPVTFVLLNDGASPRVAASYSKDSSGKQAFHAGLAPEPTAAWVNGETFGTDTAQPEGYLLIDTADGPLEVPLANLSYSLTTSERCSKGIATLAGVIPKSHADLVVRLTGVESGDPEDAERGDAVDTPVSAIFSVEQSDFDFGSVP